MPGGTSAAEWAQMVSLAISVHAALSCPWLLLVEADHWAWPRPLSAAADRVLATQPVCRLLIGWCNARHAVAEAGRDVAALVLLLTTSPKDAR